MKGLEHLNRSIKGLQICILSVNLLDKVAFSKAINSFLKTEVAVNANKILINLVLGGGIKLFQMEQRYQQCK